MTDDRAIDPAARIFGPRTEGAPPPPLIPASVWRWLGAAVLATSVSWMSGILARSAEAPPPYEVRTDLPTPAPRVVCQPDGRPVMVHVGQDGVPIVVALPADARCEPGDSK